MKKIVYLWLFFCMPLLAQSNGVNTSSGISLNFDQSNLHNYTVYNSCVNLSGFGDAGINVQVLFNTPEYIQQYYSDLGRYGKMSKSRLMQLIERNFDYSRRRLWFEVTVRSDHVEDLLWANNDLFVLENNLGVRVRADVIGRGTLPRYQPIDVDGHVYDDLAWEKTFGLEFPVSLLGDEEVRFITLKSMYWHKVIATWEIQPELKTQYIIYDQE